MVVYAGLLSVASDDDELASVLSHEVAHVLARHPAEKVSTGAGLVLLGFGLQLLGFNWLVVSAVEKIVLELPNSREMEEEADEIGVHLMGAACFDCGKASRVFEKLAELETRQGAVAVPSWLSTHPVFKDRVENVKVLGRRVEAANELLRRDECAQIKSDWERVRGEENGAMGDENDS